MDGVMLHGADCHVGNKGDGSQGFASEPQGPDTLQVLEAAQFRGCMPLTQ